MTFPLKSSLALGVCAASALIAGCSIVAGNEHNDETEKRIVSKEGVLRGEESRSEALKAEQARLAQEFATRRMSLDDLNVQLDRIRAANAKGVATSDEQAAKRRQLERRIAEHKVEIERLKGQGQLSDDEKRRRIAKLKADIDEELNIQLAL